MRVYEGPQPKLNSMLNVGFPTQQETEHITVEIHWKRGEGRDNSSCVTDRKLQGAETFFVC